MQFRILALDGGGTWSLVQVSVLQNLFGAQATGHQVLQQFDLVAANSGGSIVAAGLAEDLTLARMLDLFINEKIRRQIFHPLPWYKKLNPIRLFGLGPRFSTEEKLKGLMNLFPNRGGSFLKDLHLSGNRGNDIQFLFSAYDYDRDRVRFLRSNVTSRAGSILTPASSVRLAEAAHASSNAPLNYFDKPAEIATARFWDGALSGFNNPVLAGVIEALANGVKASEICALSVGTGNVFLPLQAQPDRRYLIKPRSEPSIPGDLEKVAQSILADPPDSHTFIAYMMLGQPVPNLPNDCPMPSRTLVRMNPLIQPNPVPGGWDLPKQLSPDEFQRLVKMDMAVLDQQDVELIRKFCDLWLHDQIPNQPIRASSGLACEIGEHLYSQAKQAWRDCLQ